MKFRNFLLGFFAILWLGGVALAQTGPALAQDFIKRGNAKYLRAEYQAAIAEYGRVSPDAKTAYAQALYNIGVCYYELWRTEEAIAMYRKAIKAGNNNYPRASYSLGVALEDLNRLNEARQAYRQAIAMSDGKYAQAAYFKLGVLAMNEDDPETATALFKEAIKQTKEPFPTSHNNLGVILARGGRLLEARGEFELALSQSRGTLPEASYNLALCRALLLDHSDSQSSMRFVAVNERARPFRK